MNVAQSPVRKLDNAIVNAQIYRSRSFRKMREYLTSYKGDFVILYDYKLCLRQYRIYIEDLANAPKLPLP